MLTCADRSFPYVPPIPRQERQAMKRFAGVGRFAIPPTRARGRAYPRRESNLRTRFRNPLLYPLSYGGSLRQYRRGPAALPTTAHLCEWAPQGLHSAGKQPPAAALGAGGGAFVPWSHEGRGEPPREPPSGRPGVNRRAWPQWTISVARCLGGDRTTTTRREESQWQTNHPQAR